MSAEDLAELQQENSAYRARLATSENEIVYLRKALQKIADLIDSEAAEPLDDAIEIAQKALSKTAP